MCRVLIHVVCENRRSSSEVSSNSHGKHEGETGQLLPPVAPAENGLPFTIDAYPVLSLL